MIRSIWNSNCFSPILCSFLLLFVWTGGCNSPRPQEELGDRAARYMELRQSGRWREVWTGLVDPELTARLDQEAFLARRTSALDVLDFEIISVQTEGDRGEVVVRENLLIPILFPGDRTKRVPRDQQHTQRWVRRHGLWYIRLEG